MPRIYPYDGRLGKAEVLDETEKSAVSAYADYQLSLLIICIESPEARFYKLFSQSSLDSSRYFRIVFINKDIFVHKYDITTFFPVHQQGF